MILKKQVYQADKKVNPFVGFLLFIISIALLLITGPLGFIYGISHSIYTKGLSGAGEFFLKIAISVDQLGNVLMQHILNLLWMKRFGYKFGNRDETISSALGRNKSLGTLTGFGRLIDAILDKIDPDHSLNSIDYYIEPSAELIDTLALVHVEKGRILVAKNKNRKKFYLPGGKREMGETDSQTLLREVKEELNVELDIGSMQFFGIFEAQADGYKPGIIVRRTCYFANFEGTPQANSEIEELIWLSHENRDKMSEVDALILDVVKEKGMLK